MIFIINAKSVRDRII